MLSVGRVPFPVTCFPLTASQAHKNYLTSLPLSLTSLPLTCAIYLNGNERLAPGVDLGHVNAIDDSRNILSCIFAATTKLAAIREPAATIMIAFGALPLPADVVVAILAAGFANIKRAQTRSLVRAFRKRAAQLHQAQ